MANFKPLVPELKQYTGIQVLIDYSGNYLTLTRIWPIIISMVVTGLILYSNYYQPVSFYKLSISTTDGFLLKFFSYYIFYLLPFAFAYSIQSLFNGSTYFKKKWFLALLLIAPAIFAFRNSIDYSFFPFNNMPVTQYWQICMKWLGRAFLLLIPVYLIWKAKDNLSMPFYGNSYIHNLWPYFILLILLMPMIGWASVHSSFLDTYPRVKAIEGMQVSQNTAAFMLYELCYGFDFIGIEFFFRGFLIHAFIKICGKDCILPAACLYCIVHLEKPMAEAISSFYGGMFLGIFSYYSRSVWGCIVIHLGMAWLMEIAGILARL